MSIFTLKRKSRATTQLSNQRSQNGLGFSLNNPRRVGAHTGEPQTQTPFKGTTARGHGGDQTNSTITMSQYICPDSFTIPHLSVKNTRGYLSVKNKWLNGTYPLTVVKDCRQKSYSDYLRSLKGTTNTTKCTPNTNVSTITGCCNGKNNSVYHKDILKMTYSIYNKTLLLEKNSLLPPKPHYPPYLVNGTCATTVSLEDFTNKDSDYNKC